MFDNQNLIDIFPENFRNDEFLLTLNFLLKEFYDIFIFIKQDHTDNFDSADLKKRLIKWLEYCLRLDQKITPYIHIFVFHVPEFIQKYKNLTLYSMQGLEKRNEIIKQNFSRKTNRKRDLFTETLLKTANRCDINFLNKRLVYLNI